MRKAHILGKNKGVELPSNLVFFDTETVTKSIGIEKWEHFLKLGVVCYVMKKKRKKAYNPKYLTFYEIKDFWDFVERHTWKGKKTYVFAHSLGFDFRIVKGYSELEKRGWERVFDTFDEKVGIKKYHKEGKTLEFLDTFNYFKTTVEDLGKAINLKKLGEKGKPFEGITLEEYCKRDVDIIKEMMLRLLYFIEEEELGGFGHSVSRLAMNTFKHKFNSYEIGIHNYKDVIEDERKAYRGGRAEAFYIGSIKGEPLDVLDVNSLYPFVMKEKEYPIRFVRRHKNIKVEELKELMKKYLVIGEAEIEVKEPIIGVKGERLIFPIGNWTAVLTSPEIEMVLEKGKIKRINWVLVYNKAPIFKSYVEYCYNKRLEAKRENNKVLSDFWKFLLNSLYGKFGQQSSNWVDIESGDKEMVGCDYFIDGETGRKKSVRWLNGKQKKKGPLFEGYDSFVAIPSFVTAYARCYMWSLIERAGKEHAYYIDTDGLFVDKEGMKNLKDFISQTELGKLKIKSEKIVEIMGVKSYKTLDERKIKGIKKEAIEIAKGVYKQMQWTGTKGAWKKGDIEKVETCMVIKKLNFKYTKGDVTKSGWVYPLFLKNGLTKMERDKIEEKRCSDEEKAMELIQRNERKRGREAIKMELYEKDRTLTRNEQMQDALREMKRYIRK